MELVCDLTKLTVDTQPVWCYLLEVWGDAQDPQDFDLEDRHGGQTPQHSNTKTEWKVSRSELRKGI